MRPRRSFVDPGGVALAGLDRRVLELLCEHRVMTQDQLARLFPDVPERTLRYRTRRLRDLGYAGRTRPYRERGSAPNHHWPTRRADALISGAPSPRGGERKQPNPVFLTHAALLSELYVTLATQAEQARLSLQRFQREGDAREPFEAMGKQRALAPDALLVLHDEQGRELRAFVELDLGTMSHSRLRSKAELYTAYVTAGVWRQHHPFLPALLFLTSTEVRAAKFLTTLRSTLTSKRRGWNPASFTAAAAGVAFQPGLLLEEGCLADTAGNEGLALADVLSTARAPYERALQSRRERQEAEDRECKRLREDPEAMRQHIRRHETSLRPYLQALGTAGEQTLRLLLSGIAPADVDERAVLASFARDLPDLLEPGIDSTPFPGAAVTSDVALLTDFYRSSQRKLIESLSSHGQPDGPSLRRARSTLGEGQLLERRTWDQLPVDAERDTTARETQGQRRLAYLEWREHTARKLARQAGGLGRLTHPTASFYPQLDSEHLKVCKRCEEAVYPSAREHRNVYGRQSSPCHYCGASDQLRDYSDQSMPDHENERWPSQP